MVDGLLCIALMLSARVSEAMLMLDGKIVDQMSGDSMVVRAFKSIPL